MYMSKFFKTEDAARAFQKEQGYGALYKNTPHSKSKHDYMVEAAMRGLSEEDRATYPYVVAWNE